MPHPRFDHPATQIADRGPRPRADDLPAGRGALRPEADVSLTTGLRKVIQPLVAGIVAARDGFLDTPDPPRVHAYRAALRRACAAFDLFGPVLPGNDAKWISHELRRLLRRLGATRDLDVLSERLARSHRYMSAVCLEDLVEVGARAARQDAVAVARSDVLSARTAILTVGLGRYVTIVRAADDGVSLRAFAAQALARDDANLRAAGRHIGRLGAHARHRLRRRIKGLRYNTETVAWLFPSDGAYGRELGELHRILGEMNDAAVCARLAEDLAGEPAGFAVSDALKADLRLTWSRFKAAAPPWAQAAT